MEPGNDKSALRQHRTLIGLVWLSLLSMVLLSPKLWVPLEREFPLVPAFGFLSFQLGNLVDTVLTVGMLAALAVYAFVPRQRIWLLSFFACTTLLILEDITRFQPWVYVYGALLLVWSWQAAEKQKLNLAWLVLGSLYFWGGFQKLNHAFTVEILPWLMEAFSLVDFFSAHSQWGYLVGFVEMGIGLGLLFLRSRKWAVVGALLTHAFILWATGPWGHNWNSVIWPWNLGMMGILLLSIRPPQTKIWSLIQAKNLSLLLAGLVLLLWLLPILNYFRLWDSHLSGSLYSGNNSEAIFFFDEADRKHMPASAQEFMFFQENTAGQEFILLDHWILDELNAPFYPETRYFKWVGKELCNCLNQPNAAGLKILQKEKFNSDQTLIPFSCAELLPPQ